MSSLELPGSGFPPSHSWAHLFHPHLLAKMLPDFLHSKPQHHCLGQAYQSVPQIPAHRSRAPQGGAIR